MSHLVMFLSGFMHLFVHDHGSNVSVSWFSFLVKGLGFALSQTVDRKQIFEASVITHRNQQ